MSSYISYIKKPLVFLWNNSIDIKTRLTNFFIIIMDNIIKDIYKKPNIKSIDETIDKVINNKCSVCRFGDGEFKLMIKKNIYFQNYSEEIASRLREVIATRKEDILVCIPDVFNGLNIYVDEVSSYWKIHIAKYRLKWYNLVQNDNVYYNAFISRFYYELRDKSKSQYYFNRLKLIWQNRDIVIIEGLKSRLGIGNDLFSNSRSIKRILCPEENAFNKYEQILLEAQKVDKSKLVLLAIGPTATILAYDLSALGYQAIDIGHIDIEYEWFLMGATKKVKVESKYVCEAGGGKDVGSCLDTNYLNQIACSIK